MRLQPLHFGHKLLIDSMLAAADTVLIGIGSVDKDDRRNPYSFALRTQMVRSLYPDQTRLRIFGLRDINAKSHQEWAEYVFSVIAHENLPQPTIYFAGSAEDAAWFEDALPIRVIDRTTFGGNINATALRDGSLDDQVPPEVLKVIGRTQ
ncbi:hypothetical protein FACS1894103_1350 [Campylobacterota bacterium]|nr:hypothetical protein FACS1894103_1350 [Campylobacterota bacterium]